MLRFIIYYPDGTAINIHWYEKTIHFKDGAIVFSLADNSFSKDGVNFEPIEVDNSKPSY